MKLQETVIMFSNSITKLPIMRGSGGGIMGGRDISFFVPAGTDMEPISRLLNNIACTIPNVELLSVDLQPYDLDALEPASAELERIERGFE